MKKLEEIKKKYLGKWIALKDSKVLATSKDYHELHQILKRKCISGSITVIKSPTPKEEKHGFLLKDFTLEVLAE